MFKVIFTELGRVEAQRHLDEMKNQLKYPNLNARTNFSPYSRGSSVQSFSSRVAMDKEATSGFCKPLFLMSTHIMFIPLDNVISVYEY